MNFKLTYIPATSGNPPRYSVAIYLEGGIAGVGFCPSPPRWEQLGDDDPTPILDHALDDLAQAYMEEGLRLDGSVDPTLIHACILPDGHPVVPCQTVCGAPGVSNTVHDWTIRLACAACENGKLFWGPR